MEPQELGPITRQASDTEDGTAPPALIREWCSQLATDEDVVLLWACATRSLSWWNMHVTVGSTGDDPVATASPAKVERLVSPFAHEGRVTILQALYNNPMSSSQLSEATGFQGGRLYHHLRELKYAAYVHDRDGQYAVTQLGRELLITFSLLADQAIVDRGKEGLAVGDAFAGDGSQTD